MIKTTTMIIPAFPLLCSFKTYEFLFAPISFNKLDLSPLIKDLSKDDRKYLVLLHKIMIVRHISL